MTTQELARLLDKNATVTYTERSGGTLEYPARIIDAREQFGRLDLLVTPTQGSGEAWVSADRVKVRKV